MTTKNPKLQAYILPNLHQRFTAWKKERRLEKDSQALNILMSEFFEEAIPAVETVDSNRLDRLEDTIQNLSQQLEALTQTVANIQLTNRLPSDSSQSTSLNQASKKAVAVSDSSVIQRELSLLEFQELQEISASKAPDESVSNSLINSSKEQSEVTGQPSEPAIAPAPTSQFANLEETLVIDETINSESSGLDTATEPCQTNANSDLSNELLSELPETEVPVNQTVALSELPNESLKNEPSDQVQHDVDNNDELLTATQLAKLLKIGDRAVSVAASQGQEYFKDWSAKKGNGAWDFQVLSSGRKKNQRMFFRLT